MKHSHNAAAEPLAAFLLDHLGSAIVLLDEGFRVVYLNSAAEGLLATSHQHATNQCFSELIWDAETLLQALRHGLEDGVPFTQRQVTLTLPAPHPAVCVDLTATPLPDRRILLEMQSMDRLMRINREEAILSSHQTTRHLARGLAHEVKNPLGGIRGAAQLLARALPDPQYLEYTRIIIQEADRLRDLVDRMLGPQEPPVFSSVNIHEVIERVLGLVKAECDDQIHFQRDYDPSVPDLHGDQNQLLQAILNVVRNAMQALLGHAVIDPIITLRTRVQHRFTIGKRVQKLVCRLDVLDNGVGIPANIRDTLFYPMISGRADGTGLGLAITQGIITQHNGLVECDSQPGCTRFSIYLPLET